MAGGGRKSVSHKLTMRESMHREKKEKNLFHKIICWMRKNVQQQGKKLLFALPFPTGRREKKRIANNNRTLIILDLIACILLLSPWARMVKGKSCSHQDSFALRFLFNFPSSAFIRSTGSLFSFTRKSFS